MRNREGPCESSVEQTDELMDKNAIGGDSGGRAGQGSRSPLDQTAGVNGAVVSGKGNGLSGETSSGGPFGVQSPLEGCGAVGGDAACITRGGVSKGHSSRGHERGVGPGIRRTTTDSRTGEGPQHEWQPDLSQQTSPTKPTGGWVAEAVETNRLQTELMKAILSSTNLESAWRRVKGNGGSGGIDEVSIRDFPLWMNSRRESLIRSVAQGRYTPRPVRRAYIRKSNGKQRPLGIPTLWDRVLQQAIHQVLSPRLEPLFSEHSHGFRPERNAQQAVRFLRDSIKQGYVWAVDIDLKSFFDLVPQERVLERLRGLLGG